MDPLHLLHSKVSKNYPGYGAYQGVVNAFLPAEDPTKEEGTYEIDWGEFGFTQMKASAVQASLINVKKRKVKKENVDANTLVPGKTGTNGASPRKHSAKKAPKYKDDSSSDDDGYDDDILSCWDGPAPRKKADKSSDNKRAKKTKNNNSSSNPNSSNSSSNSSNSSYSSSNSSNSTRNRSSPRSSNSSRYNKPGAGSTLRDHEIADELASSPAASKRSVMASATPPRATPVYMTTHQQTLPKLPFDPLVGFAPTAGAIVIKVSNPTSHGINIGATSTFHTANSKLTFDRVISKNKRLDPQHGECVRFTGNDVLSVSLVDASGGARQYRTQMSPASSSVFGGIPQPRRSDRETIRTTVTINGHTVKKTNNYVNKGHASIMGDNQALDAQNRLDEAASLRRKQNRQSVYDSQPQKVRVKSAEQQRLDRQNHILKRAYEMAVATRKQFFKKNLPTFRRFMNASAVRSIEATPTIDDDRPFKELAVQPDLLVDTCDMRDYQLIGLNFLARKHHEGMPCIIGDEMGLGKTLQTIAFLCHMKSNLGLSGPSLIVCPLSVLSSWMNEFKKWAPTLNVVRFYGTNEEQREMQKVTITSDFDELDAIVTTYDTLKAQGMSSFISRYHFRYVVLDEGHIIKNDETLVAQAAHRIHSEGRIILTGTPLQNNLVELWALLNYLYPEFFADKEPFEEAFNLQFGKVDNETLVAANTMLNKFMLRRLKDEVEKLMPKKLETQINCPLSTEQLTIYKNLLLKEKNLLAKAQEGGANPNNPLTKSLTGKTSTVNSLLMQLRKCVNHPYLFDTNGEESMEELIGASGKLAVLDKLLLQLYKNGHRCVIFSQFTKVLDIIDDYARERGWFYNRIDGSIGRAKRTFLIDRFNAKGSQDFIFLMSTRAGGMGINLQTADTCILFDSDWNPQPDLQAMARVHRIGQTKTVHVYRLVANGTAEERIVQRAQRKLYLDQMVNRKKNGEDVEVEQEAEDDEGPGGSEMLEALAFGADAIFGGKTNALPTDAEIEYICDRTRHENLGANTSTTTTSNMVSGNLNTSSFNAAETMVDMQNFKDVDFRDLREKVKKAKTAQKLTDLVNANDVNSEFRGGESRKKKSRVVLVEGIGSGYGSKIVPVLAANNYDLENGESSVFDRELGSHGVFDRELGSHGGRGVKKKSFADLSKKHLKKGEVAVPKTYDFINADYCQLCHEGGDLICCEKCPTSWHHQCLGYKSSKDVPKVFQCAHHKCQACAKTMSAAGGFIFRCDGCWTAYCDDCMPKDGTHLYHKSLLSRDYTNFYPKDAAYIHCSKDCRSDCEALGWAEEVPSRADSPAAIDVSAAFDSVQEEANGLAAEAAKRNKDADAIIDKARDHTSSMKNLADYTTEAHVATNSF